MTTLDPGTLVAAAAMIIPLAAIPAEQVVSGAPEAGFVDLHEGLSATIGVWEHTPGVSTDTETDEVFVVLSGEATLQFVEPDLPSVQLRPGAVVRLTDGMRTRWHVRQTVRKVYIS